MKQTVKNLLERPFLSRKKAPAERKAFFAEAFSQKASWEKRRQRGACGKKAPPLHMPFLAKKL
jgi:hypothetical protein